MSDRNRSRSARDSWLKHVAIRRQRRIGPLLRALQNYVALSWRPFFIVHCAKGYPILPALLGRCRLRISVCPGCVGSLKGKYVFVLIYLGRRDFASMGQIKFEEVKGQFMENDEMKYCKQFLRLPGTIRWLAFVFLLVSVARSPCAAAAATPEWVLTRTHALNTAAASFQGYAADQERVSITVSLKLRNEDALESFTRELFNPRSFSYHQWITREDAADRFLPTSQQAQSVVNYLTQNGFTNVVVAPNRLLVTADGTVGAVRQAFRTSIGHFQRNGKSGIANVNDVRVPVPLGSVVDRVLGLQTLVTAHTFSRNRNELVPADTVTSASVAGNSSPHLYYPQEFATVYDAGNTPTANSTTVAIIGWGSMDNAVNDLKQFESAKGITPVATSIVSTSSQASDDDSGQGEWALDAQAIVGVAGSVQKLIFYTDGGTYSSSGSSGDTDGNLLQVINKAVGDNTARVVNMSWGLAECNGPGAVSFADSVLQMGIAQGQTFVSATGDNGSYPCNVNGQAPSGGTYSSSSQLSINYPASSPYVVAIGGTTLNTTSNDGYISESSWAYGGGGVSEYEPAPSWQTGFGSYFRQVPDLSFDADWTNSPIGIYLTSSTTSGVSQSGWYANGGTSLAVPLFVGSWARLETASDNGLGFAAPAIYMYASSIPFHDITTGNNGYYSATAGRDNATGWGSFDIAAFNNFIHATPGFGTTLTKPGVAVGSDGWAYVFWKGADNNLYEALGNANGALSGPLYLGMGPLGSVPSAGVDRNGNIYVYWEGADRNLWEAYWNGSTWVGPINRGMGPLNSPPAVAITPNGFAYVFWKGGDNNLYEGLGPANGSLSLQPHGMGPLGSAPSVGVDGNGAPYVYWKGTDNNLWEGYWNGSTWVGPFNRGMGPLGSAPAVTVASNGAAYIFWKGTDNNLYEGLGPATGSLGLQPHGMGPLGSAPGAGVDGNGATYVYWQGMDRNLWEGYWGGAWVGPFDRGMSH